MTRADDGDAGRSITTTEIDLEAVRGRLTDWLAGRLGAPPVVSGLRLPKGSGMSSISVFLDVEWETGGVGERAELVARVAPETSAVPVFPSYDLRRQFDVMRAVAEHSDVPVPRVRWLEESPEVLGQPFLVMDRITGRVPVDNPPYVFGGWLTELDASDRAGLAESSVGVLAAVHSIANPDRLLPDLVSADPLRAHFENERAYYAWTRRGDGVRIPVLERAFEWLERNWPADPGPNVLNWGDARIGNIMYDGTDPVAVLDWESAALAPKELDLGWFVFFHRMFHELATGFGMTGMPDFLRRDDVVEQYQAITGTEVHNLDFFVVYAALRHGIVMSQIQRRSIHFGEAQVPENPDEYVMHHQLLTELLD